MARWTGAGIRWPAAEARRARSAPTPRAARRWCSYQNEPPETRECRRRPLPRWPSPPTRRVPAGRRARAGAGPFARSLLSGVLEGDVVEHRGDGFGLVGGVLEQLVEVVPAHRVDQLGNLSHPVVQVGDGIRQQVITLVFEAVNLLRGPLERLGLGTSVQQGHGASDLLGLLENDFRELARR